MVSTKKSFKKYLLTALSLQITFLFSSLVSNLSAQEASVQIGYKQNLIGGEAGEKPELGAVALVAFDIRGRLVRNVGFSTRSSSRSTVAYQVAQPSDSLVRKLGVKSLKLSSSAKSMIKTAARSSSAQLRLVPKLVSICSGIKVGSKSVLSAAHCFDDFRASLVYYVYTGGDLFKSLENHIGALPRSSEFVLVNLAYSPVFSSRFRAISDEQILGGKDIVFVKTAGEIRGVQSASFVKEIPSWFYQFSNRLLEVSLSSYGDPDIGVRQIATTLNYISNFISNIFLIVLPGNKVKLGDGDSGGGCLYARIDPWGAGGTDKACFGIASFTSNDGEDSYFTQIAPHASWISRLIS